MPRTWCALSSLVLAALACGQGDPAAFAASLDATLKKHPFFSKVDFTVDASHPPYRFYVQRPAKDDPLYVRAMVNIYLPFLDEQRRLFVEEYATPLGLEQSADMPVYAIAILASGGSYADFANAVGSQTLHMARAHYDPALRLAVTYQDAFAGRSTGGEERQAMLHEFVHALQHAHSSTGAMPKAVWYAEGLAEYRSVCTNMPNTLRELAELETHVDTMANACVRPAMRKLVAPIADLVAAGSYEQVVAAARKRAGAAVPPQLCLQVFYAQSEMFVRFLDQAFDGKYRAGFRRYLAAVQQGQSGKDAFAHALGDGKPCDLAALEQDWLRWLTEHLRQSQGARYPDLQADAGNSVVHIPLAPLSPFDPAVLAFRPDDAGERIAAARRLCARGEYEAAVQLLPAAGDLQGTVGEAVARERERILGLIAFRDALLAEDEQKKTGLTFKVDGVEVKGRLARREEGALVLAAGSRESRVPLALLRPEWLLKTGQRQNRFEGQNRWLDPWVRWLNGQKLNAIRQQLQGDQPALVALRGDLTRDLDAGYGATALALVDLQRLQLPATVAAAKQELDRVLATVQQSGKEPLFQARREGIEQLVRALAERAFTLDDPRSLGVHTSSERRADGSIRVRYPGRSADACADFVLRPDPGSLLPVERLNYEGPTELTPARDGMDLIGSGVLDFPVPLRGWQEIEVSFQLKGAIVPFRVMVCADPDHGVILVDPSGVVLLLDRTGHVQDEVGEPGTIYRNRVHKLRIVHDGEKRLEVFLDDQPTAELKNLGAHVRGNCGLAVHSSNPVFIKEMSISGFPDPLDPTVLRDQFVTTVLAGLWP